MTDQERIQQDIERHGYTVQEWRDGEDGREAVLGTFRVIEEDEDVGLYADDEGPLIACVVGSEGHHNQRVHYTLVAEGMDSGNEVRDLTAVEAV